MNHTLAIRAASGAVGIVALAGSFLATPAFAASNNMYSYNSYGYGNGGYTISNNANQLLAEWNMLTPYTAYHNEYVSRSTPVYTNPTQFTLYNNYNINNYTYNYTYNEYPTYNSYGSGLNGYRSNTNSYGSYGTNPYSYSSYNSGSSYGYGYNYGNGYR